MSNVQLTAAHRRTWTASAVLKQCSRDVASLPRRPIYATQCPRAFHLKSPTGTWSLTALQIPPGNSKMPRAELSDSEDSDGEIFCGDDDARPHPSTALNPASLDGISDLAASEQGTGSTGTDSSSIYRIVPTLAYPVNVQSA